MSINSAFNLLPRGYLPLYRGGQVRTDDPLGSYLAANVAEVVELHNRGIFGDYIYCAVPKTGAQVRDVIGKCRLIANNRQELLAINEVALESNRPGYLETVGLRVVPDCFAECGCPGIAEGQIVEVVRDIKKMAGISVGGCFVQGALNELSCAELASYFHSSYQLVKRLTTLIPCRMSYFCLCGILEAMARRQNDEDFDKVRLAADIVGMQNYTAFYSRLLVN